MKKFPVLLLLVVLGGCLNTDPRSSYTQIVESARDVTVPGLTLGETEEVVVVENFQGGRRSTRYPHVGRFRIPATYDGDGFRLKLTLQFGHGFDRNFQWNTMGTRATIDAVENDEWDSRVKDRIAREPFDVKDLRDLPQLVNNRVEWAAKPAQ